MKKRYLLLSLLLFPSLLASCSGNTTSSSSSSSSVSTSSSSVRPSTSSNSTSSYSSTSSSTLNSSSSSSSSSTTDVDYGTVSIESIDLALNDTFEIKPVFSNSSLGEKLSYTYDETAIKIENDVISVLKVGEMVEITASSIHFETKFYVNTLQEYGKLTINNVYATLGNYPLSDFVLKYENEKHIEKLTYKYNSKALEIDEENHLVTPLKAGMYDVEATSAHYSAKFKVIAYEVDENSFEYKDNGYLSYAKQLAKKYKNDDTTYFVGDSYFDARNFWTGYATQFPEYNIEAFGISSTTTQDWETYYETVFGDHSPKNIAIHLGTNNVYDDKASINQTINNTQRLLRRFHESYPSTNLYYFGITQRAYQNNGEWDIVDAVNAEMEKWAGDRDWITYVDSTSKFDRHDPSMYKDNTHPKNEYYQIFVDELLNAGCEIGESTKKSLEDFDVSLEDTVLQSRALFDNGTVLSRNFVLEGEWDIKELGNNPHIEICFNEDAQKRFLFWGGHGGDVSSFDVATFGYVRGTSSYKFDSKLNVKFKLVVTDDNAYLYIDGTLRAVAIDLPDVTDLIPIKFGGENIAVSWKNLTVANKATDEGAYNNAISLVKGDIDFYKSTCVVDSKRQGKIEDITKEKYDAVGSSTTIINGDGNILNRNFVLEGKWIITAHNPNAHIEIRFNEGYDTRFLLWDNKQNGVLYPATFNHTPSTSTSYNLVEPMEFSFKLVVLDSSAYLYINNELKIVGTNIAAQSGKIGTLFGSEGMEMTWSEMKAVTKDGDETSFNDEITKVQSDIDTYKSNLAL